MILDPLPEDSMNDEEAIAALDAIKPGDPEGAHSDADDALLALVSDAVRDAWIRARERVGGFWYA